MIYKESVQQLLKQGFVKKCPVDYKAIRNLIKRAYTDIKTAKRNLSDDEECAYTYSYNALLHSGLALIFNKGFRPEIKNKHLTIIKFASTVLGDKFKRLINDYDFMRKKRHKFIYEPEIPCSLKEAKDAIKIAEEFVDKIYKVIKLSLSQKELDF
ncbi:MAG: HEPN domain-containing protein [Candidatus Omnitrophota bacterium]|nr:HEPN domain-containing protein [Candidatus Omnitrophota bacterium]